MGFSTKLSGNTDFIGRATLEAQYAAGVDRRRVLLRVEDPDVVLMGLEPIFVDGEISGYTLSAAYGHTMGQSVTISYVECHNRPIGEIVENAKFKIEAALESHAAHASLKPHYDPAGERLRT